MIPYGREYPEDEGNVIRIPLGAVPPLEPSNPEPDQHDAAADAERNERPREVHSGQLRIAERFVARFLNELRYVHGLGWHCWNGTHWEEDKNDRPRRRVVTLLKEIHQEASVLEPDDRKRLVDDARKCETNGGITGVLDLAKSMHPFTTKVDEINGDPFLFNTLSGTLNLETGQIEPHNPTHLITKCSAGSVHEDSESTTWTNFLERVLPDAEVRTYLQRVFGLAMLGVVREHNLPILSGKGGNGKGVCYEAVLHAFGAYGMAADPALIMAQKNPRHGTFLAALHGMRLVVTSETNEEETLAAATVKRLTGGDKIQANRMRQDPFEFVPSHSLIYVTNFKPKVDADDPAMWRRLAIIPFDQTIPDEEIDTQLGEKLKEHTDAVLTWCWEGWKSYREQFDGKGGLNPPEAVLARTEEYRAEGDDFAQFFDSCTRKNDFGKVKSDELFAQFRLYAMTNGLPNMTSNEFGRKMTQRGLVKKKSNGATWYFGINLLTDSREPSDGGMF